MKEFSAVRLQTASEGGVYSFSRSKHERLADLFNAALGLASIPFFSEHWGVFSDHGRNQSCWFSSVLLWLSRFLSHKRDGKLCKVVHSYAEYPCVCRKTHTTYASKPRTRLDADALDLNLDAPD